MAERKRADDAGKALEKLVKQPLPRRALGRINARASGGMMSVAQRLAFADDIRSRSKPSEYDSTDLIRRDRDER